MTKDKFLTLRWNNIITIGLGLIVLIYTFIVASNGTWSEQSGFIGLAILGAFY